MGGISTSILFSAFEAWLVHEHKKVVANVFQIFITLLITNE
jgi:hypothetical protein